jgi:hypothetical protein
MMSELSLVELESELVAELPTRNLLRRHRAHASARASHGSAAASNATYQINFNPQVVINNGVIAGPLSIISHNTNNNATNQSLTPLNILSGLLG